MLHDFGLLENSIFTSVRVLHVVGFCCRNHYYSIRSQQIKLWRTNVILWCLIEALFKVCYKAMLMAFYLKSDMNSKICIAIFLPFFLLYCSCVCPLGLVLCIIKQRNSTHMILFSPKHCVKLTVGGQCYVELYFSV